RRTLRSESTPMGFGAARPAPKATMLVGLIGRASDAANAAAADVVVIDGNASADDVSRAKGANGATVVGLAAKDADRASLAKLREAGLDFLIFDPESTPASALLEDDLGFVLALPSKPEDDLFRSLDALQLDALYVEEVPSPLTVARGLQLMRGRRPILARVKASAPKDDLETLRAAGVAVLLVEDAGAIAALKETVLALPPRRVRRDDRPGISVPRTAVQPEQHPEEDDDDD
ncbi:MAG TPA: hypothetical protein VH951_13320, partial [Dehalococcoidia bacterium]